jgi:hypothetical protein
MCLWFRDFPENIQQLKMGLISSIFMLYDIVKYFKCHRTGTVKRLNY